MRPDTDNSNSNSKEFECECTYAGTDCLANTHTHTHTHTHRSLPSLPAQSQENSQHNFLAFSIHMASANKQCRPPIPHSLIFCPLSLSLQSTFHFSMRGQLLSSAALDHVLHQCTTPQIWCTGLNRERRTGLCGCQSSSDSHVHDGNRTAVSELTTTTKTATNTLQIVRE